MGKKTIKRNLILKTAKKVSEATPSDFELLENYDPVIDGGLVTLFFKFEPYYDHLTEGEVKVLTSIMERGTNWKFWSWAFEIATRTLQLTMNTNTG